MLSCGPRGENIFISVSDHSATEAVCICLVLLGASISKQLQSPEKTSSTHTDFLTKVPLSGRAHKQRAEGIMSS